MKPCPEWDVGAPWSPIPAPAADVPGLAGMRSTLAPALSPSGKMQRCGWHGVAAVELGEAIHYAKRYGFVRGWFGRQPEVYAHRKSTGEIEGLIVFSRPRDRIFDDGLTREVRIFQYESKEQARALLCGAIRCSRDAGATRLLIGPSAATGVNLDALGFVQNRSRRHDDKIWMRVLRLGECFRVP